MPPSFASRRYIWHYICGIFEFCSICCYFQIRLINCSSMLCVCNVPSREIRYNDVIMSAMVPQITSLTIVYSNDHPGSDQSSVWLAFVRGIHQIPPQRASNAESVPIWWRHHDNTTTNLLRQKWRTSKQLLNWPKQLNHTATTISISRMVSENSVRCACQAYLTLFSDTNRRDCPCAAMNHWLYILHYNFSWVW